MPTPTIHVKGLAESDKALREFAAGVSGLATVLARAGRAPGRRSPSALAVTPTVPESSARSLDVGGDRLGRGGIFESSPNRLEFGTEIFYARFAQHGTKKQRARRVIHVDETDIGQRLALWAKSRAAAAGLEVA